MCRIWVRHLTTGRTWDRFGSKMGPGPILALLAQRQGARATFQGGVMANWQSGDILVGRAAKVAKPVI
jgi:hypothetical protein